MIVVNSNADTSVAHEQPARRTATFADMAVTMCEFRAACYRFDSPLGSSDGVVT